MDDEVNRIIVITVNTGLKTIDVSMDGEALPKNITDITVNKYPSYEDEDEMTISVRLSSYETLDNGSTRQVTVYANKENKVEQDIIKMFSGRIK